VGYGEFEGGFIEWELGVKYRMLQGKVYAMAGYRSLGVKLEEDDEQADLELAGFTFGLGVSF
jgi:hypothetical protein